MVNVRAPRFGHLGSGDDTHVFNAARDAAGVSGTIIVPPGQYILAGFLATVPGQMWLLLDGATITLKDSSDANTFRLVAPQVKVSGGTFNGNITKQTTGGIGVQISADDCTVSAVAFVDHWFRGVGVDNCHRAQVTNNRFTNCGPGQMGALFGEVNNGGVYEGPTIRGNYVDQTMQSDCRGGIGYKSTNGSFTGGDVSHNRCHGPPGTASFVGAGVGVTGVEGASVANNEVWDFDTPYTFGGLTRSTVSGNKSFGGTFYGLELADCDLCAVTGNVIDGRGTLSSGIVCDGTPNPNARNLTIVGNLVKGFTASGIVPWGDDTVVEGNHVSWDSTVDGVKGVYLRQSGQIVSGNQIRGPGQNGDGIYSDDATTLHLVGNQVRGVRRGIVAASTAPTITSMLVATNRVSAVTPWVPGNAVFTAGQCRIVGNVGIADHDY